MLNNKVIGTLIMLCVAGMSTAAVYEWNGSANSDWNNGDNWTVTGSPSGWTYPNDEDDGSYTNRDCTEINIENGDTVTGRDYIGLDGARDGKTTAVLTVSNGSTLNGINAIWIADYPGTKGIFNIDGATVNIGNLIDVGNDPGSSSTASLNVTDGVLNVAYNGAGDIRIGVGDVTADMTVSGSSTVTIADDLILSNGNADSSLTIEGGSITVGDTIEFYSASAGTSRIYINGGILQGEALSIDMPDAKIVFGADGVGILRINASNLDESGMHSLMDSGRIDVSQAPDYLIYTDGDYTVLESLLQPILVLTPSSLTIPEGESDYYDVSIATEPGSDVTVTITPDADDVDLGSGYGNAIVLSFPIANWSQPQRVNVNVYNNPSITGDHSATLSHLVTDSGGVWHFSKPYNIVIEDTTCGYWGYYKIDYNKDCRVNFVDYAIFLNEWMAAQ